VLGVFSQTSSGNPWKNKVFAYLANHNTEGSRRNTVKNMDDKDLELVLWSVEAMLQLYSSKMSYN